MIKQQVTIDITKNPLSPGDAIHIPAPRPDGATRTIRVVVRGKKYRDPKNPLKVEYEVEIDPKGFRGAWTESEMDSVLQQYNTVSVLTIDPNEGHDTVYSVETGVDTVMRGVVSPERVADTVATFLLEFPTYRKGSVVKYRTTFKTVMEWLIYRGMLPKNEDAAKDELSLVTKSAYAQKLFTSQGGWITLHDHANIHKAVTKDALSVNPYYDPSKDGKIVVDFQKLVLGLHLVLDSFSNVVIINDKEKHKT
jgi:hypothetical protein